MCADEAHRPFSTHHRTQAEGDLECVQADLDEISATLLRPQGE
jgi:hypothetical protein